MLHNLCIEEKDIDFAYIPYQERRLAALMRDAQRVREEMENNMPHQEERVDREQTQQERTEAAQKQQSVALMLYRRENVQRNHI